MMGSLDPETPDGKQSVVGALNCDKELLAENADITQPRESQAFISDQQRFWAAVSDPPDLNYRLWLGEEKRKWSC